MKAARALSIDDSRNPGNDPLHGIGSLARASWAKPSLGCVCYVGFDVIFLTLGSCCSIG